jgi:hypothetical protein
MIIPRHIQIETINGVCTSYGIMCTKQSWTRKPNVMISDIYIYIEKVQTLS